jgi:hypothetical protein
MTYSLGSMPRALELATRYGAAGYGAVFGKTSSVSAPAMPGVAQK